MKEKLYSTNRAVRQFKEADAATDLTLGSVNLITETAYTPGVKQNKPVISSKLCTARDNVRRTAAPDTTRPSKLKAISTKKAALIQSLDQNQKSAMQPFINVQESSNGQEIKGESETQFHIDETLDDYNLGVGQNSRRLIETTAEDNIELSCNVSKEKPMGVVTNSSIHKFNLLSDWRWVDIDDVGYEGS